MPPEPPIADPLIDVLMPARNAAATIAAAVGSIQKQTLDSPRIIAVDDGSTDGTADILARLAREDPRITVLRGPQQGVVGALNLAFEQGSAEFVARQDADDLAWPERLATQVGYLRDNPDCVCMGGALRHVGEDGRPTGSWGRFRPPELSSLHWIPALEPYVPGPVFLARRTALEKIGAFRPMHVAEDSDMSWRLQEVGRLHNTLDPLGDYRVHPNSISSRSIRHGRVMAVCSQRAALSARRRRAGRSDLDFSAAVMTAQDSVSSLADLSRQVLDGLDATERRWFEAATAAKLIELALYRPFELEREDCEFIASAMRRGDELLTAENRAALAQMLLSTSVRLAASGRLSHIARLMRGSAILPSPQAWAAATAIRVGTAASARLSRVRSITGLARTAS